jgi:hypothetical protein
MKAKSIVVCILSLLMSACATDSSGNKSSLVGMDGISSAISTGVDSIKSFDAKMSGKTLNEFPIEKTVLYNVFEGKPFNNTEDSSYPRVAITVLKSPAFHSTMLPMGGSDRTYDAGCFSLSATIWHGKSRKEVIDRFDFCTPSDGVYGVPLSGVNQWAIRPVLLGVLDETGTGLRRTTGPGVPTNAVPSDPRAQKYLRSTSIDVKQYDGFMLASVLYKMGFDWSQLNDRRVWIVGFPSSVQ